MTESDWRLLAMEALRQMRLGYARRAFIRVRDMRYIELLNQIEIARRGRSAKDKWKNAESKVAMKNLLRKKSNDMFEVASKAEVREKLPSQDQVFLGHILAYQSRFTDAARVFEKAGHVDLAIEMFLDLKRYDDAKSYASKNGGSKKHSVSDLMKRQAEWSKATADWRSAAQMYADAGEYVKAIELLCENHGVEPLMDIVHKLDGKSDVSEVSSSKCRCGSRTTEETTFLDYDKSYSPTYSPMFIFSLHSLLRFSCFPCPFILFSLLHPAHWYTTILQLRMCAEYFAANNHHSKAKQVFLKMNAIEELLRLHMRMHKWEEALALAEQVSCSLADCRSLFLTVLGIRVWI